MSNIELQNLKVIEDEDIERQDLISREQKYLGEELRNSMIALISGGLIFIFSLAAMILTWNIYDRQGDSLTFTHAIFLTIAMLYGALICYWAKTANKLVTEGSPQKSMLSLLVFLGSIFFTIYS